MEILYLNFFVNSQIFSRAMLRKLKKHCGSWEAIYKNVKYIDFNYFDRSIDLKSLYFDYLKHNDPNNVYEKYLDNGILLCSLDSSDYPYQLKNIADPPLLLYFKGNIKSYERNVAIVGTRNMSIYGYEMTSEISNYLCLNDINIISGLATGVDMTAHEATVRNGKSTTAILGQNLFINLIGDRLILARKILENEGCIISEYPYIHKVNKFSFPERNRIIAGLSNAIIVTEAPCKSGALITAKYGLDEGREIYVIPGDINRHTSFGCNSLIKDGANVFLSPQDFITEMGWNNRISITTETNNLLRMNILDMIRNKDMNFEKIIIKLDTKFEEILKELTLIELDGLIKKTDSNSYTII